MKRLWNMIRCELKANSKYIGVCLCIGIGVGLAVNNLGAGIALGLALSSALSFSLKKCNDKSSIK